MENITSVRYRESIENSKTDKLNKNVQVSARVIGTDYTYKHEIAWLNAAGFLILHLLALWGCYTIVTGRAYFKTVLWATFLAYVSGEGITIGAHRHYAHKSFTATPLLRAILIYLQTLAGQNSMYVWCRDHRLHHRYSDTDADPHNAKRGFFFSHMGWLMSKKHPYVRELGRNIDMSDLEADWMVMFQKKYFLLLYVPISIIIPVWVPIYYFGESIRNSFLICYFFRYIISLNITWLVNSAAHLYGTRPYDKNLKPVESWIVAFLSSGEGWHNYHHTFPWDYKAAELTMHFNFTASIIRMLEKLGLAYNLKSASPEIVSKRIIRTGDGTHYVLGNDEAKSKVKAIGPLHPLNPTYNSTVEPETLLTYRGLPLFHEMDVINNSPEITNRNTNTA